MRRLVRTLLPVSVRRRLSRWARWPPVGRVDLGALRRLEPISPEFGGERGRPVDRHYIEAFLGVHAGDVAGRVLEVGTDMYTRRFGGSRVEHVDVLHVAERRPGVTIVADLTRGDGVPAESYDCVVLTQTLQFVYDVPAALATVHRALVPGGVLLATVPGISQISGYDDARWGDYWRFMPRAAERLFGAAFPGGEVSVETHGNVLASVAFLHGLAVEELRREELDHRDPRFPLIVAVRARKAGRRA